MENNTSTFVSPGVYTREVDLSFVTSSVGVTTLGVVGETLKGPAFEPIFITNKDEFFTRFGGQSTEKFANGVPKYELPYIANSYLEESNQLFVTRILGLSGYDAGKAWVIKTIGAVDEASETEDLSAAMSGTTSFTGSTLTFSDSILSTLLADFGTFDQPITALNSGSTFTSDSGWRFIEAESGYTKLIVTFKTTTFTGATTAGTGTYTVKGYKANRLTTNDNITVAVLRSRGEYVDNELVFKATGVTSSGNIPESHLSDALGNMNITVGGDVYNISLNESKQNYITKVLGASVKDKNTGVFVESAYPKLVKKLVAENKIGGLQAVQEVVNVNNYKSVYKTPESPFVVSEVRGLKVEKLFKFISISDGDSANKEIKISIENVSFDTKEFDVIVRAFADTDSNPKILESFRRCSLNPKLNSFIGKRIGTSDGDYKLYSKYIMVEMAENAPVDAIPAGFEGYKVAEFAAKSPLAIFKTGYTVTEKVKKAYLGISDIAGIDQNLFNYQGEEVTGTTLGFHLDSTADATKFVVGGAEFKSEGGVAGTAYEKIGARKFTLVPAGGFDGWDIYRTNRTNTDDFREHQAKFSAFTESLPSDYYAYLKGIRTFANPDEMYINLFATPGIDYDRQNALVKETIEMIEEDRADALYVVTTPFATVGKNDNAEAVVQNMVDVLDAADIDSNYTTTFAPWVQIHDEENGANIYLPPTFEYVRLAAETDNKKAPWFATAGFNRGQLKAKKATIKINQETSDILYDGRINPIRSFPQSPLLIFGNRNLQVNNSALDRNNVRRLMLQVRKLVSAVAVKLVFEQNDADLKAQFLNLVNPILASVKQQRGVQDFKVVCDSVINTSETRDRLELRGRILIKPTLAAEFIDIEFGVTGQGANFSNI